MPIYGDGLPHNQETSQFGDKIYFVYRSFPLNDIHPHAQHSAETDEAAAAQDNFWQMHDYLFEHQKVLDNNHLLEYAKKVGLDISKFKQEISGHVYAPLLSFTIGQQITLYTLPLLFGLY
jgi:protein-disulfide isomerase